MPGPTSRTEPWIRVSGEVRRSISGEGRVERSRESAGLEDCGGGGAA